MAEGKGKEAAKDVKEEPKKDAGTAPEGVAAEEGATPEGGAEGATGGGLSKKKLILIVVAALVLLAGVGAGLYFSGIIPHESGEPSEEDQAKLPQTTYFDLEEFLVNLNNPGKQVSFLKMTVTLQLPNLGAKAEVEKKMPHVRDSFQVYLRELRSVDLQGSAGIQRLREELLLRLNKIIEPEKVEDILFKEIIVQ